MISVLVSAYQAQDYLEDLIKSIDYDKAELLICIDDCFDTFVEAKRLEKIYPHVRWFDSNTNNGPYININSLVNYAKYDYVLPFGADDHFKKGALDCIISAIEDKFDVIRFKYTNYKGNKYRKDMDCIADGAFCINKSYFVYLGGFMNWRCGADTELKLRAIELGAKEKRIDLSLFMRRLHDNNLTLTSGLKSMDRIKALKYIAFNKGNRKTKQLETIKLNRI